LKITDETGEKMTARLFYASNFLVIKINKNF